MEENRIPINEQDLFQIINSRVSLDYTRPKKFIRNRVINNVINLTSLLTQKYSGAVIDDLTFVDCTFNMSIDIGNYEQAGIVIFNGKSIFNDNVNIQSYGKSGNVQFEDYGEFKKNLTVSIAGSGNISNLSVNDTLTIKSYDASEISLTNINKQIENQKFICTAQCVRFHFANANFSEVYFSGSRDRNSQIIIETLSANKLTVEKIQLGTLHLKQSKIEEIKIDKIEGNKRKLIISDNCTIANLRIILTQFNKMDVFDSLIKTLILSDINSSDSILNIQKITLTNLLFQKVYNEGLITIREPNMESGGMISVKSSNLGKTDFINCDFSKAVLEFENSKVTEVFLSETDFPKQVKNGGVLNFSQAQLAFGQFNTAFQNQGDTIRALEYQSREVEAHYKNLKKWHFAKFPWVDFNKLNLWLNKWSNNFGRYWARGIVFTFVVAFIFFNLTINSTDLYNFSFSFNENMVGPFLKFVNPLRHFDLETLFKTGDDTPNLGMNPMTHVWDFLGRLFVAYGYYQTIQAFRRFGRK